jgi:hypothetical protein
MNVTKSKALTVEATIVAACEDNVIPGQTALWMRNAGCSTWQ